VLAITAVVTAGVSLAFRDSSQQQLEHEASRLAAWLDAARASSRASGVPVRWRVTGDGFAFEGLAPKPGPQDWPSRWLGTGIVAQTVAGQVLLLGPEPVIGPQRVWLSSAQAPTLRLSVRTDGVGPFVVEPLAPDAPALP
jgi:general secretion pathway protein H